MRFPTTHWTRIERAPHDPAAMAMLVDHYFPAIRAFIGTILRDPDDADDAAQEFVQSRILTGSVLERADRSRGRFHTYLKKSLRHFAIDVIRTKTSSGKMSIPASEIIDRKQLRRAERALDKAYAQSVLHETLEVVKCYCDEHEMYSQWRVIEAQLLLPATNGTAPLSTEALMAELRVESEQQIYSMKQTMFRIINREMRKVLTARDVDPTEVGRELKYILDCLQPED